MPCNVGQTGLCGILDELCKGVTPTQLHDSKVKTGAVNLKYSSVTWGCRRFPMVWSAELELMMDSAGCSVAIRGLRDDRETRVDDGGSCIVERTPVAGTAGSRSRGPVEGGVSIWRGSGSGSGYEPVQRPVHNCDQPT